MVFLCTRGNAVRSNGGIVQPKKHPSELFTGDLRKNAFNLI